jgi:hypothetical protein
MSPAQIVSAVLIVVALGLVAVATTATVRERNGLASRHYANLLLPCGLVPLLLVLVVAGPRAGIGTGALILLLQVVTSAVESHLAGRVTVLTPDGGRRSGDSGPPPSDS